MVITVSGDRPDDRAGKKFRKHCFHFDRFPFQGTQEVILMSQFDSRSERLIGTLLPAVQPWAREFLRRVREKGIDARIISGTRSYAEQNELYAQGRTRPGSRVTNARGGFSNHNFGIAWDVGIFEGSRYLGSSKLYAEVGKIGRDMGLEWGGDWKSFPDTPHFQVRTGLTLRQLRSAIATSSPIPVPHLLGEEPQPVAKLEAFLNGEKLDAMCRLKDGRVCVAARDFCEAVGGTILDAGGRPFRVEAEINGESKTMPGEIFEGVGFVRFIDLNELLGYQYEFKDGKLMLRD